jgi:hypothetical protein
MTYNDGAMVDPSTGLAIPQQRIPSNSVGMPRRKLQGTGTITYRCHTCGESIVKPWEVIYVDLTPGREYASTIVPPRTGPGTTTHHDWHMASPQ